MDTDTVPNSNPPIPPRDPAAPATRYNICTELAKALTRFPNLYTFFASYSDTVIGTELYLLIPHSVSVAARHCLEVLDWAFKTCDSHLNESNTAIASIAVEGERLIEENEK
jgi:hypothetical protein